MVLEGWEAWDLTLQLSPQIQGAFPLAEALLLGEALGYRKEALALLLPAISVGLTKARLKEAASL